MIFELDAKSISNAGKLLSTEGKYVCLSLLSSSPPPPPQPIKKRPSKIERTLNLKQFKVLKLVITNGIATPFNLSDNANKLQFYIKSSSK
jgi:hypothetical protein